jgi:ribosome biogenesis GTPase
VGDRVECSLDANGKGRVDRVLPRRNWFIRPAVANIDLLVFLAANVNPVTDPFLIDRLSVIAEEAGCGLVICINKSDLDPGERLYRLFSKTGYPVVRTSAETGEGADALRELLRGKVSAFTGNSGVGKSSLLNVLLPGANIKTAEVSEKLGRGKHTTRHSQLLQIDTESFIFDTPGFSSLEVMDVEKEELAAYYAEFTEFEAQCRFGGCSHVTEPSCGVKEAVKSGEISRIRYENYCQIYEELKARKKY